MFGVVIVVIVRSLIGSYCLNVRCCFMMIFDFFGFFLCVVSVVRMFRL